MFNELDVAPPDAILGLTEAFVADENPEKINLSVGVFKNEAGVTPILESVKEAERRLCDQESTKAYLPITGLNSFVRQALELLLGADHEIISQKRAVGAQTPGGTGALRVAADFIRSRFPEKQIWCSRPTWANHPSVFAAANLPVQEYAYFDAGSNSLDFEAMMKDVAQIPKGDVILLHGCCHNPTGIDPDPQQWKEMSQLIGERNLLPLVDFAYQGFGDGLEEDALGLRTICDNVNELLVASSYSKNFGLYSDRVGALTVVAGNAQAANAAISHIKTAIRRNYSNPPAHGGAIVSTVLQDPALRQQWEAELREMRDRINGTRDAFVATMTEQIPERDFSFISRQRGMFSFSGLTPEQVDRLRDEYSVYIVRSGRINVAGITPSNIKRLCECIRQVLN